MNDIWPQLEKWFADGERFAMATVVKASKPSPRGVGATLAVHEDGERFIGSVSAGCVEHEVIEAAKACLQDGQTRWLRFGPGEGFPWEIELSCGGTIEVRVEPAPHLLDDSAEFAQTIREAMEQHELCMLISLEGSQALVKEDSEVMGGKRALSSELLAEARRRMKKRSATEEVQMAEGRVLFRLLGLRRRVFVIGASHIALHLAALAKMLQHEVVVVDPRESYARMDRFQIEPDRLWAKWPEEALEDYTLSAEDALIAITHDPKIDDRALSAALKSKCGYIGALGSRKSHDARCRRLAKAGYSRDDLNRIHGPVGLDIGSRTPAEIAVSIVAQMIQSRNRGCQR